MEQKDYILREISKIGQIINAIRQLLFGGSDLLAITLDSQIEEAKGMLLSEMNFDLDKFLELDKEESEKYLHIHKGFNVENIEALAICLTQIASVRKSGGSQKYLEKALQLYELCDDQSKTFSVEREQAKSRIRVKIKLWS
ncbi:MAG: hypothetical protein PHO95_08075 [Bacteroidales bacterium]|jgi:hypothetical protein|nr:hypothetical protein [Bacteroidales bacterium]